jgi:hypothetical protein
MMKKGVQFAVDDVSPVEVRGDMRKAGFTEIAISLSLESLRKKKMIEYGNSTPNDFGNYYTTVILTQAGLDWLLENQERFQLTVGEKPSLKDEDIPF